MRASRSLLFLLIGLFPFFPATADYFLNPGDQLEISVWQDESLKKQLRVLPDGTVSFPLVGQLHVAGLTTQQAEQRIAKRLATYIAEPQVSVVVTAPTGNIITVVGKVNKPGAQIMTRDMRVVEAIAAAGGVTRFAKTGDIRILRGKGGEAETTLHVDYKDIMKGKKLSDNRVLQVGDVVLVP
jgi:polysaccharide export outer membrane protein